MSDKPARTDVGEPPVMGADCGLQPLPTQADRRAAWRNEFVRAAVDSGALEEQHAQELFEAGADDWDYDMTPADALAEELSYWDNDEDLV